MNQVTTTNTKDIDLRQLPKLKGKKLKFTNYWLDVDSETFADAYKSAKRAGFSDSYARVITGNAKGLQWIKDAKELMAQQMSPDHTIIGIQSIAHKGKDERNRLRALELLAKIHGMFIDRSISEVNVQFTNSVPRPIVDADVQIPGTEEQAPLTDNKTES